MQIISLGLLQLQEIYLLRIAIISELLFLKHIHLFFAEVVSGISEIADKNGYVIMYCDTNNDEEKEERALLLLRDQGIKGLILTPARDNYSPDKSKHIKQLIGKINVPVVFVDRKLEKTQMWDGVYIDHFNCAYIATQSLIEDGYKNIAIITPNLNLNIGAERLRGYIQALTDNGITIRDEYIFKGDWSNETSYNSTKQILKMNKLPDAVFNANNRGYSGCC